MKCVEMHILSDKAKEFDRESLAFRRFWNVANHWSLAVDDQANKSSKRAAVLGFLEKLGAEKSRWFDCVAVFCHGLRNSIQLGFDVDNVDDLGAAINKVVKPLGRVVLYCCSTAKGFDSDTDSKCFARELQRSLIVDVYAHSTAGHTTRNPYTVKVHGFHRQDAEYLVKPKSDQWKTWNSELHALDKSGDIRFMFPFMTSEQIDHWLESETDFRVTYGLERV